MDSQNLFYYYLSLFNKTYMLQISSAVASFFLLCSIFLSSKEVVSVCIDRNNQWSEFFYAAVPECLWHSRSLPRSYDLFYFCSSYYGITCGGAMELPNSLHARSVFSFIPLPMITRTPVSFNSYSIFHSHTCCRSYRYHFRCHFQWTG